MGRIIFVITANVPVLCTVSDSSYNAVYPSLFYTWLRTSQRSKIRQLLHTHLARLQNGQGLQLCRPQRPALLSDTYPCWLVMGLLQQLPWDSYFRTEWKLDAVMFIVQTRNNLTMQWELLLFNTTNKLNKVTNLLFKSHFLINVHKPPGLRWGTDR